MTGNCLNPTVGFLLCNIESQCGNHEMCFHLRPDNSDDFSEKLALLSNQWQGVVRRAQQQRGIIDSLVRQWQNYREMTEKLLQWLQEVAHDLDVYQPGEPVALQQARNLLGQIQVGRTRASHPVSFEVKVILGISLFQYSHTTFSGRKCFKKSLPTVSLIAW